MAALAGSLNEGCSTVGVGFQIEHIAPCAVGTHIVAEAHLDRIEGRKLLFTVSARDSRGLVAAGKVYARQHENFLQTHTEQAQPHDVAAMFFTSGTTGNPKGVVHTHNSLLDRARAGADFDKLTHEEEVLAYLPPAWIGQNIFSYAQWLACGYVVNCPESSETVTT